MNHRFLLVVLLVLVLDWVVCGNRFSALAGADLPVRIENNGPQAVADYRFHGSVAWRF